MRKLGVLLFSLFVLVGCNAPKELSAAEVEEKDLSKDAQSFHQHYKNENGVFLLVDPSHKKLWIYFNSSQNGQEHQNVDFSGFEVKGEGEDLRIYFTTEEVAKPIVREHFLEIQLDKEYDSILLFENGENAAFRSITST